MKRCFSIFIFLILMAFVPCAYAEMTPVRCSFSFSEDTAQIGKPFSFSYNLTGGSGQYTDISIEAEYVTVHDYTGSDVDDQYIEKGSIASGTVSFTPAAGKAIIFWLRGYDAVTQSYFYFECHEGWVMVDPNPDIPVSFQYLQNEAIVGETLSANYNIESNVELAETKTWWQIGGEWSNSERCEEKNLDMPSGLLSFVPSHGEYIYIIIQGRTEEGEPFYAESDHLALTNPGVEKIKCICSFPENDPEIGKPYSFSYVLSGGSGSFSDINVEAEFVTVHDYTGCDVDDQRIELGTATSGTVSFIPTAGTAIILWLRGKDAITQQSFYFECHEGWLPVSPNPNYPVSFRFDKSSYSTGDSIEVNYQIDNLPNGIDNGKIWWLLVSDFELNDHLNTITITDICGSAEIGPSYGTYIYAVLEGKDHAGNPIYAESEHLCLGNSEEINNVFNLPKSLRSIGDEAFSGTAVQKVVLPSGLTITNIADNAFQNTSLKIIVGNSEDAKTYALDHGVIYEPIEK